MRVIKIVYVYISLRVWCGGGDGGGVSGGGGGVRDKEPGRQGEISMRTEQEVLEV